MELRQAVSVRLLDFGHILHDLKRHGEETAVSAVEDLAFDLRLHLLFNAGDGGP